MMQFTKLSHTIVRDTLNIENVFSMFRSLFFTKEMHGTCSYARNAQCEIFQQYQKLNLFQIHINTPVEIRKFYCRVQQLLAGDDESANVLYVCLTVYAGLNPITLFFTHALSIKQGSDILSFCFIHHVVCVKTSHKGLKFFV